MLGTLKARSADLRRRDSLWHFLLQSMATMGNSRGAIGLIEDRDTYDRVRFRALQVLARRERLRRLESTLRRAGVRYPQQKAR